MKGISSALLALIFVAFSLLSLLTAERSSDESLVPLQSDQAVISQAGLGVALHRYLERAASLARSDNSRSPRKQARYGKTKTCGVQGSRMARHSCPPRHPPV